MRLFGHSRTSPNIESYESLRKAAAGLPHSKSLLRNTMRDSVVDERGGRLPKSERGTWGEPLWEIRFGMLDGGPLIS
jgi:hypothetical protein